MGAAQDQLNELATEREQLMDKITAIDDDAAKLLLDAENEVQRELSDAERRARSLVTQWGHLRVNPSDC